MGIYSDHGYGVCEGVWEYTMIMITVCVHVCVTHTQHPLTYTPTHTHLYTHPLTHLYTPTHTHPYTLTLTPYTPSQVGTMATRGSLTKLHLKTCIWMPLVRAGQVSGARLRGVGIGSMC